MIKKVLNKFITCMIVCLLLVSTIPSNIYADDENKDFWSYATEWYSKEDLNYDVTQSVDKLIGTISGYIELTGTVIIIIAAIVLGIKYVLASAEGKAIAKENIISLLVACIFFFGWANISNILYTGKNFVLYSQTNNTYQGTILNVYNIFKIIFQIVALIAILYVGIKYIFAGAEGKANLKSKSWAFVIGMILIFSTIEVLNIVSKIINESLTVGG